MIRLRAVIDLLARPSLTCPAIISILLWSLLYYKNEKKWAAVLLRLPQPTICQILIPSAYAISFPRPLLARSHYFRDHLQAPSPVTLSSLTSLFSCPDVSRPMRSPHLHNFSFLLFLIARHPLCSSALALPSDSQDLQRPRPRVSRVYMLSERRFPLGNSIISYFQKIATGFCVLFLYLNE